MTIAIIIVAGICLAYANGANDIFKGVATLFGSGTTDYRRALLWATLTTFVGSVAAVVFADRLLEAFSGKGLVSADLVREPSFATAVALGAGLTVLIATRLGMPVSTTHSLVGALIGAGWAAGSTIDGTVLGSRFLAPLLVSPLLALFVTAVCYPVLRHIRLQMGITAETCLCIENETIEVVPATESYAVAIRRAETLSATVGDNVTCESRYSGRLFGLDAGTALDRMHFMSSGVVSFARGLNDTPKIAALMLIADGVTAMSGLSLTGIAIAVGGLFSARRVAETISHRITPMNHGQGFAANVVTGLIVIGASRFGLPVSTTHVSCGSLFGIGVVTRQGFPGVIAAIVTAWVLTLPLGAAMAMLSWQLCHRI